MIFGIPSERPARPSSRTWSYVSTSNLGKRRLKQAYVSEGNRALGHSWFMREYRRPQNALSLRAGGRRNAHVAPRGGEAAPAAVQNSAMLSSTTTWSCSVRTSNVSVVTPAMAQTVLTSGVVLDDGDGCAQVGPASQAIRAPQPDSGSSMASSDGSAALAPIRTQRGSTSAPPLIVGPSILGRATDPFSSYEST